MSGRRSSRSDGTPTGIGGGSASSGASGTVNDEGVVPTSTAIACSNSGAIDLDVHHLRACRLELRLGLIDIGLRNDAAAETVARQFERALVTGHAASASSRASRSSPRSMK